MRSCATRIQSIVNVGAAVPPDQVPHEREPDAKPLARALGRFVHLHEEIPHLRELVARDAHVPFVSTVTR